MQVTFINKTQNVEYDPSKINAQDLNELKTATNSKADQSALDAKANKVNGTVPLSELPPVYFNGITGTGTSTDPYTVSGGSGTSAEAYLKSLPGYTNQEEKILYSGINGFSWGAVPSGGNIVKLATPTITFGTPANDGVAMSWKAIENATSYTLQRAWDTSYTDATIIYTGANLQFADTGLSTATTYYYRLRAFAAGYTASDYYTGNITTAATGGLTPITTWLETEGFIINSNNLQAIDESQLNRARSSAYIPAGQSGTVQFQGYGRIGLDDNPSDLSYGTQFIYGVNCNSANRKLTTTVGSDYTDAGTVPGSTVPYVRFRVSSTEVFFGFSLDGSTWSETRNVARTGGDLYIKADEGYNRLDYLHNILGSGITINSALS